MATSVDLDRAKIHVIGDRLVVRGGFAPGDESRYSNALFNYYGMGHKQGEIDLTRVRALGKPGVDMTISFAQFAGQTGRTVVVLANKEVARELQLGGYGKVGEIRVI